MVVLLNGKVLETALPDMAMAVPRHLPSACLAIRNSSSYHFFGLACDNIKGVESLLLTQRGRSFREEAWVRSMAKRIGMESTLRPLGEAKAS